MSALRRAWDHVVGSEPAYRLFQAPFSSRKLQPFLKRVDLSKVRSVLDVGCGPGTNAAVFAGCDYVGVDIDPAYIESARRRHSGRFLVGDVGDPSVLGNERFDLVFANSLMHHLPDGVVRPLLKRMSELTTPTGAVHVLDLVLPPHASPARLLARLDRGAHARPLDEWRTLFSENLRELRFETYPLGLPGLCLWQMVYFQGVAK